MERGRGNIREVAVRRGGVEARLQENGVRKTTQLPLGGSLWNQRWQLTSVSGVKLRLEPNLTSRAATTVFPFHTSAQNQRKIVKKTSFLCHF